MRFDLSYHSPVTGGGLMHYDAAGDLGTAEVARVLQRLHDQQERDLRLLVRMHGGELR